MTGELCDHFLSYVTRWKAARRVPGSPGSLPPFNTVPPSVPRGQRTSRDRLAMGRQLHRTSSVAAVSSLFETLRDADQGHR